MKRYSVHGGLFMAVLTIVACGGGSAPPAEQAVAPGAADALSDAAGAPPTRRFNTLYLTARGSSPLPAECVARAGAGELVLIRGDEVRWRVRNAMGDESCKGLPMARLELVFERAVLVGVDGKPTDRVAAMPGNARVIAQVYDDRSSEGLWKYIVCYNGAQASEDPWLDIYGDEDQPIRPEGDLPATTTLPSC